ncbi:SCO3933 family regulatory protein [Streptomyces sp. enrichment culture]|uniref:SCO3933 family regulatory protein n=1 Tax=Streptomyces sp. enrichment culture TaxID=1795815 RepID=UPI003F56D3D4
MVALPIDTAKFTGIICAVAPMPRIANRETGQVRVDRDTGQTVYQVGLCLMSGRSADVVTVNVPGEPSGVENGVPVQVRDLVATPWENEGRHGVSFRATEIKPLTAPAASSPSGSSTTASGKGTGQ